MRASSVVRLSPRILAAPRSPLTRHPVFSSTDWMCRRSTSSSVGGATPASPAGRGGSGTDDAVSADAGDPDAQAARPRASPLGTDAARRWRHLALLSRWQNAEGMASGADVPASRGIASPPPDSVSLKPLRPGSTP